MKGFEHKENETAEYQTRKDRSDRKSNIKRDQQKKGKPNIAGTCDFILDCLRVCTKSRESKKGDWQCHSPLGLLKQKSTDGVAYKQ